MFRSTNTALAGLLALVAGTTAHAQIVGNPQRMVPPQSDGVDSDRHFPADMPPLHLIPPAPMPAFDGIPGFDPSAPSSVTIVDAEAGTIFELPARFSLPPSGLGGSTFPGADGNVMDYFDRGLGTMVDVDERTFPARANCKVAMRFTTTTGGSAWYLCSGTMIDAETVLIAAHCVYNREANIMAFANEVFVFPGWDGNGNIIPGSPSAGIFNHYGYGRGTTFTAGTNYINSGDWDADMAMIRVTRAVGSLTGWFSYAWDGPCDQIQTFTYHNFSFPAEGCGTPGLHTGSDMKYWYGSVDNCPGNQLQIETTPGCYTALWGGQSGSGLYFIQNGNRHIHGVASTSNRTTIGNYCKMWAGFADAVDDFIGASRGTTFDLQALDCNFAPASIPAGESTTTANFLAVNATNADPGSATYTLRTYLSTNSDISTGDTLLRTETFSWDFAPMGTIRVTMNSTTIPENTPPGDYFLGVVLDAGTDADFSNNDSDEWDAVPITVTIPIPNNDACSPGFNLPFGTALVGTNAAATNDGSTTCGGTTTTHKDVWYRFTAPYTGTYIVESLEGGTLLDTVVSVHSACPGTAANTVACDDDSGFNNLSRLTFAGVAGTTYVVRVGGYNGASGTFSLLATLAPPANDACASATTIGLGSVTGTNRAATNDGTTNCGDGSSTSAKDVWYAFTPTCTNYYTFDTEGSELGDTLLSIHSGCPGTALNTVACDDDSGTGFQSYLQAQLNAGTTYYVRVSGYGGTTGEFVLNVDDLTSNNLCSRVPPVYTNTPTLFSTCNATPSTTNTEGFCRFGTDNTIGPDIWFRYTALCDGTATAAVCGSSYDSTMVVYNSVCPGTFGSVRIACSDDRCGDDASITWTVTEGASYLIRIGGATNGFTTSRGSGVLNVTTNCTCPWTFDDCYADYNNDQGIDGDDVIAFFGDWDANLGCADVNRDGGVDGDDVIAFFTAWDNGGGGLAGC